MVFRFKPSSVRFGSFILQIGRLTICGDQQYWKLRYARNNGISGGLGVTFEKPYLASYFLVEILLFLYRIQVFWSFKNDKG